MESSCHIFVAPTVGLAGWTIHGAMDGRLSPHNTPSDHLRHHSCSGRTIHNDMDDKLCYVKCGFDWTSYGVTIPEISFF